MVASRPLSGPRARDYGFGIESDPLAGDRPLRLGRDKPEMITAATRSRSASLSLAQSIARFRRAIASPLMTPLWVPECIAIVSPRQTRKGSLRVIHVDRRTWRENAHGLRLPWCCATRDGPCAAKAGTPSKTGG
jgi:hypothetical protein